MASGHDSIGFVAGAECRADTATVERAVSLAAAAAARVRVTSSYDRAAILDKVANALAADAKQIARALTEESGYLTFRDMELEVQRAAEVFTLTAACVRTGLSDTLNLDAVDRARGSVGYIRREPIGPILGITAYNGPLLIAAHKVAPAIAAGAPIIVKPSPRVPRSAVYLGRLVAEAGWEHDAIAVLSVDDDTTMNLVRDPRLPVISFTGGEVGWTIKEMVPRKRVHLELGGVGAVLIARDANVDLAARECAVAGFVRSGQSCIAVQRIYVERPVLDTFVERFVAQIRARQSDCAKSAIGPMVDEAAAKRVQATIEDAKAKGASVACGGNRAGALLEPTVLTGATGNMLVMRQEVFGPVVAISAVDSVAEAIAEINAVSGAIQHGVFTSNIDTAFAAADQIKAGGVIINGPGTWRVDHMPYGGTGTSGYGREGIRFAIEEFTEPKMIVVRPSNPADVA